MALTAAERQQIQNKYPAFAYLLTEPELANLFEQSIRAGWGPGEFQSHLMATNWWKSRAETTRNWSTIVNTDPGEAKRQRELRRAEVGLEARRLGLRFDAWTIALIAEQSLSEGWDSGRITQQLVTVGRRKGLKGLEAAGDIRASMQSLKALTKQYAVTVSDHTLGTWAMDIAEGKLTEDGIRSQIVNLAKTRIDPRGENTVLRQALDAGLTTREAYAGVLETVANELEIDPNTIDLTDTYWGKLLDFEDEKGAQRPMNQTEATRWARNQGAWQQTNSAKESYAGLADAMTAKWGMRVSS